MEQTVDNNKSENSNASFLNYKDEERKLSESLYRNLHVMLRFHEPTPEFLQVFEPHMFIKSNPKAFLQVSHFIFNCLDPVEFKKRFLWPIDKTGETRFRKFTLDYMNHLNTTHQLGLETLQLSNIHIPGGLKFIKVIHKFTYLIMKEEIRKRSNGPLPSVHEIPDANEKLVKLEELVDQGMDFVTRLQVQSDKLVERIDAMNKMMEPFFEGSATNQKQRCLTCIAKEWRDELDSVAKEEVTPQLERINVFSKQSIELNELLTKLFVDRKENVVQYDKDKLVVVQNVLKKMNPDLDQAIDGMIEGNFINFDNLFQVFSSMLPKIMDKIEKFIYRDLEAIQFESDEVATLYTKASTLQVEVNDSEKSLLPFVKMNEEKIRTFYLNNDNAPFMIMQTPPISRRCQINRINNRLALMDENVSQTKLFKEPSMRRTALKNTSLSKSILSYTTNSLRSQNAALGIISKSKTRGHSLNNISGISKFSTPKFSSTMCSTVDNNNKKSHTELKFSTMYPMTPTHVFSENITETTSVVSPTAISVMRKVSTNSVYHFKQPNDSPHTISPTRRFHVTDLPRNFITTTEPNGHQEEEIAEETTGVQNMIAAMNAARIDTEDFIANVSDTLLNDVSLTD